ncbi:YciI family protein [Chelatococcus sp. GCM10030263]|uniref:YciI family protein n=1 Tax=Chelatococcus sp. GCM10030263 TaxID=3273387 RepID=UPI00360B232F
MAYFLLRLRSPRPTFPFDASEAEMARMKEHAAFWQGQADAGAAIVVRPVFDPAGTWGMEVEEVEDEPAAQALLRADPAIAADLGFSYDVLPVPSLILRRG